MNVSQLEPAERDPKRLRATALKLVAFMIISAVVLIFAYGQYTKRTGSSERPSLLTKITDTEVELLTADGELRNLQDLQGQVTLALISTISPQTKSEPSMRALDAVMKHFADAPEKPGILVFVLDGKNTQPSEMKSLLAQYGSEPMVMRVVASEDGKNSLRSFLGKKMRFGMLPREEAGDFIFDTSLVLLDQHLHVRGPAGVPIGWDFEKVVNWQRDYTAALKSHAEKDLIKPKMSYEELEEKLIEAVKYLYANPNEKPQR